MQSRYYNPEWGRFINADDIEYLGAGSNLTSYNLFAYCGNNPIAGYDPSGYWDWGVFWDVVVTLGAGLLSVGTGITVTTTTGNPVLGFVAGVETFSALNNTVNYVYYSYISDGASDIEETTEKSAYVDGYVSRWERLDYTKQQTGDQKYTVNAWRYHSEYSLHMYGWYATGWAMGKNIPLISDWSKNFEKAHVDPRKPDPRPYVVVCTILWGFFGL